MATNFQLEAALGGNLEAMEKDIAMAWAGAGRDALTMVKDRGLEHLRASLIKAGLGERLANAWRAEIYPRTGFATNPALMFWTKAPVIVGAHQGEVIQAGAGKMLAIPIPDSPAVDFPNPRGPETKVDYARKKFGDRLFVIPANAARPAILAAEGVALTKTGRVTVRNKTKSGKYGKGTATIFLFFLVDHVELQDRLDVDADFAWIARLFNEEYPKAFADNLVARGLT